MSTREPAESLDRQFELLTIDYERTLGIADGLVTNQNTTRGIAATAYLAFLGLGVDHRTWALCVAAALTAAVFAYQDARTTWIYKQLVRRANKLERLFQRRLQALDRPYDEYPAQRLRTELEAYEFGVLSSIERFRAGRLVEGLTAVAFVAYLLPILLGVLAAVLV